MRYAGRHRSYIWPAILIVIGAVALLVNLGLLPAERLYLLVNLWPLILIVIGLELILRRSLPSRSRDIASVLILLLAIGGAAAYVIAGPTSLAVHTFDARSPAAGVEQASLEIDVGAANMRIATSDGVEGDLYRVHVEYSASAPTITFDQATDIVRIAQGSLNIPLLQSRRLALDVKLNQSVAWSVTENSGASTTRLDLSHARIGTININTGASSHDLYLGDPTGIVPVTINGGSLNVHVHRPQGVATSIAISGGAVNLNADGRQTHGIGNVSWQSAGFSIESDGYQVEVHGGACNVTLDAAAKA